MSVLSEGSKKVNMTMKKLPETYAKYILERYLHYPELELAERPDLQNKEESLGVEVTQCDFCELEGLFRRIASGDTSRKAKKIKDKLRNRFYEVKKMYLTNVIHVMINSLSSEFQSVFSFTCDDVKYHRISCSDFSASAYFESQGLKYPLNPHLFTLQIEDINQQVDHDLFEFLDSKYPIEGCKWMQAVSL